MTHASNDMSRLPPSRALSRACVEAVGFRSFWILKGTLKFQQLHQQVAAIARAVPRLRRGTKSLRRCVGARSNRYPPPRALFCAAQPRLCIEHGL